MTHRWKDHKDRETLDTVIPLVTVFSCFLVTELLPIGGLLTMKHAHHYTRHGVPRHAAALCCHKCFTKRHPSLEEGRRWHCYQKSTVGAESSREINKKGAFTTHARLYDSNSFSRNRQVSSSYTHT